MGFWVTFYKIDRTLPYEYIRKDLEMDNPVEITPGIYKRVDSKHFAVKTLEELKTTIEENESLERSDIVEWQVDEESLKNPSEEIAELMRTECNYFIMKFWGLGSIAIEKEKVFVDLTLQELGKLFRE